ncbi:hypothetical protein [Effusibacillus consociatus]|uniref:Uncharacterized protein n=1 Tax=Effusibacillus consociatus TaxID=1117041 RepID=A0ABV9Q4Z9_9BACL
MNWRQKAVGLGVVLAALSTPIPSWAAGAEGGGAARQEVSKDSTEVHEMQRQINELSETVKKQQEQLRSLAEQKHVKLNIIQYDELIKKIHQYNEVDKKLQGQLNAARQSRNESKQKEILAALTANKKNQLAVMQEAERLLSSEIQKLKNLPSS